MSSKTQLRFFPIADFNSTHGALTTRLNDDSADITAASSINPFGISDVGSLAAPVFADIDGDKLLNAFIGNFDGNTVFFQNTSTSSVPAFAAGFAGGPARANASTVDIWTNGNTTDISAATLSLSTDVTAVNEAPTGSVTISGTATQGQALTAANTIADLDGLGDIGWLRGGAAIDGATSSTYNLSQLDVGWVITVFASYTDGQGTTESVTSTATWNVVDAPRQTPEPEPTPEPENAVKRLYNSSEGRYLFSSNQNEIDILTGSGWVNEGTIYSAPDQATAEVFRFYIPTEGRHFYTALESERDLIIGDQATFYGWDYEGGAFSAYSTNDFPSDAVAVFRYLNEESGNHLYTSSTFEQEILDKTVIG